MEKVQDVKGLGGMLNGFRELVKYEKKITFVGSPGFCTPFALFLGYPVRDKELAFVPGLKKEKARSIISTEYGLELGDKSSADADVVVALFIKISFNFFLPFLGVCIICICIIPSTSIPILSYYNYI